MSHPNDFLKDSLLALLPEGALRQLVPDGSEDLLWSAIADAIVPGFEAMQDLANIRNPELAEDLESLEREYGFLPDVKLTEQERRARIKALKYANAGSGSGPALQDALHLAGFTNLVVGEGRQYSDPAGFIPAEGEYVVNGFEFITEQGYNTGCNVTESPPGTFDYDYGCNGNLLIGCQPLESVHQKVNYVPTDNFHLVFFVAQEITYDVSGYITSITPAPIPYYYRNVIREIILRIKPLQTWCYLAADWTYGTPGVDYFGFGFFPFGISPHGL